ncbi:MAG: DUF3326 domain-containing protein [Halobacteriovoraceae bacterium]|nr:DUF3326 domain-containing protein [Halobacteriovoraceae bacterium]
MANCVNEYLTIPSSFDFKEIKKAISKHLPDRKILNFTTSNLDEGNFQTNVLTVDSNIEIPDIFKFSQRQYENEEQFNACFIIPTGIGCEIGGHAGDATPALRLIANQCDQVVTHPNVVNASDINEIPKNALYVEGYHLNNFLMGNIGLMKKRKNRILAVIEENDKEKLFENLAINSVNGARATLGIDVEILKINLKMKMEAFFQGGQAKGKISNIENLFAALEGVQEDFDTIAISSIIHMEDDKIHETYSKSEGNMVNPWGGVESMLTHLISARFNKIAAHAPMLDRKEILGLDVGIVDPRIAPEIISMSYFYSVLKGLHKAPQIVSKNNGLSIEDISALIIPEGVFGIAVLAALHQGVKVIAVKNENKMTNDLSKLPWKKNQFFPCDNYLEAAGLLSCLREGIEHTSIRRPINPLDFLKQKKDPMVKDNYLESMPSHLH